MQELAESGPDPVRTIGPAHLARQEWLASAFCEPLSKCEGRPPHAGANAIQTQQRKIAHAAALCNPLTLESQPSNVSRHTALTLVGVQNPLFAARNAISPRIVKFVFRFWETNN